MKPKQLLALTRNSYSKLDMQYDSNFHAIALILRHCMAIEKSMSVATARKTAEFCGLIQDGKPTRDGRIVATLMHSQEDICYEKVRRIRLLLDSLDDKNTNKIEMLDERLAPIEENKN